LSILLTLGLVTTLLAVLSLNESLKVSSSKTLASSKEISFLELRSKEISDFITQKINLQTSQPKEVYKIATTQPASSISSLGTTTKAQSIVPEYSKTNVRTQGVDEPDIAKTDGRFIYLLNRYSNNFYEIFVYPPQNLSVYNKAKIKAKDFVVYKDKIIFFTREFKVRNYTTIGNITIKLSAPITCVKIYTKDLEKEREFCVSGYYDTSRLVESEGVLYIVSHYPINNYPILPQILVNNTSQAIELAYAPKNLTNIDNIFVITRVNLRDNSYKSIALFMEGSNPIVYASPNNLYIITYEQKVRYSYFSETNEFLVWFFGEYLPKTSLWDKLPKELREKIEKIMATSLNVKAKALLIQSVLEEYKDKMDKELADELEKITENALEEYIKRKNYSIIVKVGYKTFKPEAMTKVPGKLINQFAIDEYNNTLRVATTLQFGFRILGNNIYTLNSNLDVMGKLEGFEKGERIYAVRYFGNITYIVTYRQLDPFLVIDLSNPKKPKILGKLKIPGYSTYLHPIGNDKVLAIGKEGSYIKVSLYDVSDLENPKELSKVLIEGNSQLANVWNVDYKAFLYDKRKQLIFFPVRTLKYRCYYPIPPILKPPIVIQENVKAEVVPPIKCFFDYAKLDRVVVIKINGNKLEKVAELYHADVSRELYIGNYIYTISPWEVKAWNESDWKLVKNLELEKPVIYRVMS